MLSEDFEIQINAAFAKLLERIENNQYYGVIMAPGNQRLCFDLAPAYGETTEEKRAKLRATFVGSYKYGFEQYEVAQKRQNFDNSALQFLSLNRDAAATGEALAGYAFFSTLCGAAADMMTVFAHDADLDEPLPIGNGNLTKIGKEAEVENEKRQNESKRIAAYYEGYDKGRADAFKQIEENRDKKNFFKFW